MNSPSEKACAKVIDIALAMIERMTAEEPDDDACTVMLVDAIGRMMLEAGAGLKPDADPRGLVRARAVAQMDQVAAAWLAGEPF